MSECTLMSQNNTTSVSEVNIVDHLLWRPHVKVW